MRFSFHPLKDKFVLCNSWKDPAWTDVKSIRAGIDGDEKEKRECVFGKNMIDIKQKTIPQLLVDEVCIPSYSSIMLWVTNEPLRHSIHSTFSRLQASCFGLWMSTTIMLRASFSSLL
jgi:cation-transporting ATPase 13A3/4/5